MKIIGITGTLGAGKGAVVDYLCKHHGFLHFSVRDYIANIIKSEGNTVNRDSLTKTANEIRKKNHPAYIVEQLMHQSIKSGRNSVIESIRTPGEIELLRSKQGFLLLAVDADIELRYKRIQQRQSATDKIDFKTFVRNEQREMHSDDFNKQNLSECIKQADYTLINNGTLEELHEKIRVLLKKFIIH
ncbi:MAG: AAA family ATPase [Bacteroidota bacterium]